MNESNSRRAEHLLVGVVGALAGGLAVAIAAKLIPKLKFMSGMMAGKG